MTDRLINSAWWMLVMTMICASAGVALFIGYRGLFELMALRWASGGICLGVSLAASVAAIQLCRHRNDLL